MNLLFEMEKKVPKSFTYWWIAEKFCELIACRRENLCIKKKVDVLSIVNAHFLTSYFAHSLNKGNKNYSEGSVVKEFKEFIFVDNDNFLACMSDTF